MSLLLSPDIYRHPTVIRLSNVAFRLYVTTLCSADQTPDGILVFPGFMFGPRHPAAERELVQAGLWAKAPRGYFAVQNELFELYDPGEERSKRYYAKKQRALVIARDGMICGICREAVTDERDIHIDHIVPLRRGGGREIANLQVAHRLCNIRKGSRTDG